MDKIQNPYSSHDFILRLERLQRHVMKPPRWYKGRPMVLSPKMNPIECLGWIICLFTPRIYKDRFQRLRLTAAAKGEDVYARENRDRAARVWQEYCCSLVDEWKVMNVIAAILLTAAVPFLMGEVNAVTYYALIYCIVSALGSIAHAAYYTRKFRARLNEESYNILQLDHYLCHYCTMDNIFISVPLVEFIYALGAFLTSVLAHLWPHTREGAEGLAHKHRIASQVIILAFVSGHFVSLIASAISCQSLFLEARWMLDEEKREIQLHINSLRAPGTAKFGREALYKAMPIFKLVQVQRDNGEKVSELTLEYGAAQANDGVSISDTDLSVSEGLQEDGVAPANRDGNRETRQLAGWNRKVVQLPSDAIPFGFEGVPENLEGSAEVAHQVIGQLYVGKVELKGICHFVAVSLTHGDRMIVEDEHSPNQKTLKTWCRVLCGLIGDFGWLKVTLENSHFKTSTYQTALDAKGYKFLSLCRPGCACVNKPLYAACLNPKDTGTPNLGCVRENQTTGLFIKGGQVVPERDFYILLVKKDERIRGNSL